MNKVAVITRTKDRPQLLSRALRSVASQTYQDYVHVVVNDGGNVEEIEGVINAFDGKDKVVLFHRNTPSGAPDTIFNESIDRVESEFFALHDDDDTWHQDFLKETVQRLEDNRSLGAVVVRADKLTEEITGELYKEVKREHWMPDLKSVSLYRQCIDNQLTPIATLYRRSAYEAVGKFDSTLPVVGDWEFGIRLLQQYDVDYYDPGFALANYHHRKYVEGSTENTSFAGNDKHRYYTNLVMNRYLRNELSEGRLGVGYIISKLRYNQANTAAMFGKFLPQYIVRRLKRRVSN